jgi:hypothetical protein
MSVLRDALRTMDLLREAAVRRRIFRAMRIDIAGDHRWEANTPCFAAPASKDYPARPEIGNAPPCLTFSCDHDRVTNRGCACTGYCAFAKRAYPNLLEQMA